MPPTGHYLGAMAHPMTTTIALETSKGNLSLAMGLGVILISLILLVNAAAWGVRLWAVERAG